MTQYLLRPLDTQFHRSGLPFDAAQDVETESIFPPNPRTVYGALRAWGFSHNSVFLSGSGPNPGEGPIKSVLGDKEGFGSLRMKGPVLCRIRKNGDGSEALLPLLAPPADLVREKYNRPVRVHLLRPDLACRPGWNLPDWVSPVRTAAAGRNLLESINDRWFLIKPGSLEAYLTGNIDNRRFHQNETIAASDVFQREWHLGIARSRGTKSVVPGYLYLAGHFRMVDKFFDEDHALWIEVGGDEELLPKEGVLRLGGEARPAGIAEHRGDTSSWYGSAELRKAVTACIAASGRFKLLLVTPGAFGGKSLCKALPDAVDLGGAASATLVGFCLPRPVLVGGWDIAGGREKRVQTCAPAGSVYFFQCDSWDNMTGQEKEITAGAWFDAFHGTSKAQAGDAAKEGFGLTLVGGW